MAENTINDFNTLPEQVQLNKEDIKTLNAKIDTITSNIANLGWELKTNTRGDKSYIPKNFDENIPYSLTNLDDSIQDSGLNTYKDSDGYVWSYLTIYIPTDKDFVGIWTGHDITDGYFCSLCMGVPNDKTTYLVVTYIADSDCPQSLNNNDTYKEDLTIATMGWVNKYYLTKTDASNIYVTKVDADNTYVTKVNADNTYVTKQDYDNRFEKAILTLTEAGFNKIKNMVENEGTTITLNAKSDYTEQVPPINPDNLKELILNVKYGVEAIYSYIHLVPNTTLDDYDNLQGTCSYFYTGHAMLILPASLDNGYFIITYQKGVNLILRLIMHY